MRPSDVEPVVFGDLNDGPNELLRTILDDPRVEATAGISSAAASRYWSATAVPHVSRRTPRRYCPICW